MEESLRQERLPREVCKCLCLGECSWKMRTCCPCRRFSSQDPVRQDKPNQFTFPFSKAVASVREAALWQVTASDQRWPTAVEAERILDTLKHTRASSPRSDSPAKPPMMAPTISAVLSLSSLHQPHKHHHNRQGSNGTS